MSVSLIRLSAAVMFSVVTDRLLMVCSSLFWIAPRSPLVEDTVLIAVLLLSMAVCTPPSVLMSTSVTPKDFALVLLTGSRWW